MGFKLLLADDSITIQKVVGIIFATEDYELTIVDNGNAALEKALAIKPDVMLVDALMPGKSGYEVCEAVRHDPQITHTPILLLTGAFEPFDENQARKSGADDFISKPFESQHLIDKVKHLITIGKERASAPAVTPPPAAVTPPPAAVTPPAVAATTTTATPAADIWGEAAPVKAAPTVSEPTISTQAAKTPIGEEFSFAEDTLTENVFAAEPVATAEAMPASADDDLWGAFELEEVKEGDEGDTAAVVEVYGHEPPAAGSDTDMFAFVEEPQASPAVVAPIVAAREPSRVEDAWGEVPADAFSFTEEPAKPTPIESFADVAAATELTVETQPPPVRAIPPEQVVPATIGTPAIQFETAAGFTPEIAPPVTPPITPPVTPPITSPVTPPLGTPVIAPVVTAPPAVETPVATAPPAVTVAPDAGTMTLSEEQLTAMMAKISRDIIERIAWEVVPNLAEAFIKEEIRKIREGK